MEPENLHLFLLVGQSNMAGRGAVEPEDRVAHPRVLTLDRSDHWVPAVDPIHFDKPFAGVGLGRTFGIAMAERHPDAVIGLIPRAAGGSFISSWEPGAYWEQTNSHPYDDAIRRAKVAMQYGRLKGILWHQGESEAEPGLAEVYEQKLHALIQRFRHDLAAPDVPFIVGQMGRYMTWNDALQRVNLAHESLPGKVPHTAFVSSDGLTPMADQVHFDAASLREFGRRYAAAYTRLTEQTDRRRRASGR